MNTELTLWIQRLILADNLHEFYTSPVWRRVRAKVLRDNHYECERCKKKGLVMPASTVHHRKYLRMHPETSFVDVYDVITDPVKESYKSVLKKNYHATKELITGLKTRSMLRFNTSSKRGKDSKRTGCVIFDEKHEYTDVQNMNTLKSGLGKVWHGRIITITTDGHVRGGVLDQEKEQNRAILKEYNPMNRTLVFWCRIEDEKEWDQIDKLVKAIPSLNNFPSLKTTIEKEIIDMPYNMDYYPEFMAKRCNFPVGNKETQVARWEDIKAATGQELPDLTGRNCVGGVDYAQTNDFVAVGLTFRMNGVYYHISHTFVCSRSRDLPGIKAPLKTWEAQGDLEFVDDVEVPPELIVDWFVKMGQVYNILMIALDDFRFPFLHTAFARAGFDAHERKNVFLVRPSNIMKVSPIINRVCGFQNSHHRRVGRQRRADRKHPR